MNTSPVQNIAFDPSGNHFVVTSNDSNITIWDLRGNLTNSFRFERPVRQAQLSPDSKSLLVIFEDDLDPVLFDSSGEIVNKLSGHTERISFGGFSPRGKYLLTSSYGKTFVWNREGDKIAELEGKVDPDSFNDDSIVTALYSKKDKTRAGDVLRSSEEIFITKVYSSEGELLWESSRSAGHAIDLALSPDGKKVAVSFLDAVTIDIHQIWDIEGKKLASIGSSPRNDDFVEASFSPDSNYLIAYSDADIPRIYDLSGRLVNTLDDRYFRDKSDYSRVTNHSVTFSDTNDEVLVYADHKPVRIISLNSQNKQWSTRHTAFSSSPEFIPNSNNFITANLQSISVWDSLGNLVQTQQVPEHQTVTSFEVTSTGNLVAFFSQETQESSGRGRTAVEPPRNSWIWNLESNIAVDLTNALSKRDDIRFSEDGHFFLVIDSKKFIWLTL